MNEDEKYIRIVKDIVMNAIDTKSYAIFLFGSRARKKHSAAADIDIGVLGLKPLPEKIIFKIKDIIDSSIVPYKIDIIDFYNVDPKFKSIALKEINIWNHPSFINLV